MTASARSGIPTTYRGTNLRSRLEARWASFFDLVGWSWTYEPLDADGYIPDFLIAGAQPFFVEVGPCITEQDYREKSAKAAARAALLRHDVLVVGVDALSPFTTSWDSYGACHGSPGWLGEHSQVEHADGDEHHLSWDAAVWTTCTQHESTIDGVHGRRDGCGGLGITHDSMTYSVRPCRHYPGGRVFEPRGHDIRALWAEAGNQVQWHRAP